MADEAEIQQPVESKNPLYSLENDGDDIRTEVQEIEKRIFLETRASDDVVTPGEPPLSIKPSTEQMTVNRICPKVNCPERIVVCFDVSSDLYKPTFRTRAGDKFTPIQLLKRALQLFMLGKSGLNKKNQFALVLYGDTANWVHDFTSDSSKIIDCIDNLEEIETESCNMGNVFDVILQNAVFPKIHEASIEPPPYVIRCVLFYGRSTTLPHFGDGESWSLLNKSHHFFVDALFIHDPPSEDNCCEEIFNKICDLDEKGLSYIYEVSRNPTKLYDSMAKLLAHPLQRPLWKNTHYCIETAEDVVVPNVPTEYQTSQTMVTS